MDLIYRKTQIGYTIILVIGLAILACLLLYGLQVPAKEIFLIVGIFLGAPLAFFSTLTVGVTNSELHIHFGPLPLITKKWKRADFASITPVKNHWLHGWGIHYTLDGWVYNVSGYGAIEIELQNGKKFRIGTNDKVKLAEVLTNTNPQPIIAQSQHIEDV